MAAYAAMIDRMDQSDRPDCWQRLEAAAANSTTRSILFLSDNGGCAEFMAEDGWAKFFPDVDA